MTIRIVADDMRDAYMKINNEFIFGTLDYERGGVTAHHQANEIYIKHATCDLALDEFGYERAKWSMLTKLYFDAESFGLMIARIKHYDEKRNGKYMPHLALQFRDRGNRSGACLLAISIGFVKTRGWELEVFTRASEVSTRLPADFIFLYKIIQEICKYIDAKPEDIAIRWHAASMYQSILSAPMFMVMAGYEDWILKHDITDREITHWQMSIIKRYHKAYMSDGYSTYKSQRRAVKAYQKQKAGEYNIYPDTLSLPTYTIHNGAIEDDDDGIFKVGGFK